MRELIITVCCILGSSSIFSQDNFNNLYTHYHQVFGSRIIEHDELIYFSGQSLDTLNPFFERNLHVSVIDLQGNLVNYTQYNDEELDDEFSTPQWSDILVYKDHFLLPCTQSDYDRTVSFEKDLNLLEIFDYSPSVGPSMGNGSLTGAAIFPDDHEFNFIRYSDLNFVVSDRDLLSNTYELHDYTKEGHEYVVSGTHRLSETQLLVSGTYLFKDDSGNRENHVFGHFSIIIDDNYSLISEQYYPQDISGSYLDTHSIVDHDGNLILSVMRIDREVYNNQGQFSLLPIIQKIDLLTGEVLWESVHGEEIYRRDADWASALVECHGNDGFVIVGNIYNDNNRRVLGGSYSKYDSNGELQWNHTINDDHPMTSYRLGDVLASSDGYYVASGLRSDFDPDDGYDTRAQAWVIKFDDDGELAILSNTEDQLEEAAIDVYPNPVDDILQITLEKRLSVRVVITNSAGQEVLRQSSHEKDIEVNMSTLAAGTYYVLLVGEDDALLHQEQVVRK